MYSSPVPWKVLSSCVGVGVLTENWNLDTCETTSTDEVRSFIINVSFDAPFDSVPVVQLGLTGFDFDQSDSSRVTVKAENITEFGFQAVISTWATTRVYAVEFNWLAIGA